jgi:trehalose-6-phosphate synthase
MSLEERRERWLAMIGKLRSSSVQAWFSDFVAALAEVRRVALPASARSFPQQVPFGRAEQSAAQGH